MSRSAKTTSPDPDAEAVAEVIRALVKGMGRGGLSWMAARAGQSVSAFRKRLISPSAGIDAVSLRLLMVVTQTKSGTTLERLQETPGEVIGNLFITTAQTETGKQPRWTAIPEPEA